MASSPHEPAKVPNILKKPISSNASAAFKIGRNRIAQINSNNVTLSKKVEVISLDGKFEMPEKLQKTPAKKPKLTPNINANQGLRVVDSISLPKSSLSPEMLNNVILLQQPNDNGSGVKNPKIYYIANAQDVWKTSPKTSSTPTSTKTNKVMFTPSQLQQVTRSFNLSPSTKKITSPALKKDLKTPLPKKKVEKTPIVVSPVKEDDFEVLCKAKFKLPPDWIVNVSSNKAYISFFEVTIKHSMSTWTTVIKRNVSINKRMEASYNVLGLSVVPESLNLLSKFANIDEALNMINRFSFMKMCKGMDSVRGLSLIKDNFGHYDILETIRHKKCKLLSDVELCSVCSTAMKTL